jgi:hypothetical protein
MVAVVAVVAPSLPYSMNYDINPDCNGMSSSPSQRRRDPEKILPQTPLIIIMHAMFRTPDVHHLLNEIDQRHRPS